VTTIRGLFRLSSSEDSSDKKYQQNYYYGNKNTNSDACLENTSQEIASGKNEHAGNSDQS
jgi:hypothetical protein